MSDQPSYLIDIPPATISGELHMGHMFSYAQMDFVARYHQMMGKELIYPFCYDNNGLPTEKLAHKNQAYGKDEILSFSQDWSQGYLQTFESLGLALSPQSYNTFDSNAVALAQMSFQDLKDKGLVYKAHTEFFWCPVTQVSVSQSELTDDMRYERSGEKVEIRSGEGYFVRMIDHLPEVRQAIEEIQWHPEHFKHRLLRWLDDLKFDWSISRERNFGIPIPGEEGLVFDTWFTSSLSPQMAYCAGGNTPTLDVPTFDARFQAHDIIRTWALFTIVKSLYHNNRIPWKHIVISGHAVDKQGKKLSKSSPNYKPATYYFEQWGADPLRFWAAQNPVGTDTKLDESVMLHGKKLINKIKNARRFLGMQSDAETCDEWMSQWMSVKAEFCNMMESFNWSDALKLLTKFFWHTYCDIFIEANKQQPATLTLSLIMDDMLDCYSIFMPEVKTHTM